MSHSTGTVAAQDRMAATKLRGAWFLLTAVMLLWSGVASANERLVPSQVPVPAVYFGMHFHRTGESTEVPKHGIGAWRLWDARVAWRYLDPKNLGPNYAALDKVVSLARIRHIELLYTFGATPQWASARPDEKGPYGPGSAAEPRTMDIWLDFVRRTGRRYKGQIPYYETWNEPNAGFFTGDLSKLVDMTCSAARVLREEDPAIKIVTPSGVSAHPDWLDKFLSAGGERCVDVISWHFYTPHGAPETMLSQVRAVQDIMRKHGLAERPLWNTEAGWRLDVGPSKAKAIDPSWPKLDGAHSAAYVARALLVGWAAGIQRYYYYSWDHDDMGFLRVDGRPTASADAFLAMRRWMEGSVVKRCESVGDVWTCDLEQGGLPALIAWREAGLSEDWTPPAGYSATESLAGERAALAPGASIALGIQPMLLTP